MYKFKDDINTTALYFVKAYCDGQVVRMYATADEDDAFKKAKEYDDEGFYISMSLKAIKYV